MRLISLELGDFRQFRGRHEIQFAADDGKNVTLIFGANGGGKTTLLNAFTWVLYGEFTPDLEEPERIINNQVWAELPVGSMAEAAVALTFEHGDETYVVSRAASLQRTSEGQEQGGHLIEPALIATDISGRTRPIQNVNDAINQMLPERLHQFFFFNGERIAERLARGTAYDEIEQAIKTILGLEILERAARHVPLAAKQLQKDLAAVGTTEQKDLADKIDDRQGLIDKYEDERRQFAADIAALEAERDALDARLRESKDSRELQAQREVAETKRQRAVADIEARQTNVRSVLNDHGFLAFVPDLPPLVRAKSDDLRSRGELPTPLKRQFVDDLLQQGQCICGTPLEDGSAAAECVHEYRRRAALQDVEERWIGLAAQVGGLQRQHEALRPRLDELLAEQVELLARHREAEEELSAISVALEGLPAEDAAKLEGRRRQISEDIKTKAQHDGQRKLRIAQLEKLLEAGRKELKNAAARDEKAAVAQRRLQVADEVVVLFEAIGTLLREQVRRDLDEKIREVFTGISYKADEPELTSEFELKLWTDQGGERKAAAKSTGENQLLAISFVGALAAYARERDGQSESLGLGSSVGGVFPLVMDAAFGNLDENYREHVGEALPTLAPQVVVLVSKAQAQGAVEARLGPHVGAAYTITYFTAKSGKEEDVAFRGDALPYIVSAKANDERASIQRFGSAP